ncbi:MAG: glycosyltransferase family 39 protein [Fibrobacteria bacterium]
MLAALILHLTLVGGEEPDQWKKILSEIPPAAMKISGFLPPAVLLALYALLMTQSSRPIASDENIYFYMAKDFAEGAVPYRDFFFAHPPMKILLLAALFKLFGFSFTLAKLVSPVTGAATGFALWILCRQYFGGLAAFLAMTFFLLSNNCLSSTAFLSGAEMTTFFMAAAVLFSLRCRYYLAGFLFGLAALTGVYAAAGICAALALGFFRDARSGWKQFLAFTGVFVAGNLICWIAGGQGFLDGVYAYHGLKAFSDPRMHPLTWEPLGFASTLVNNLKAVYSSRVFLEELLFQPAHWMALAVAPIIYLAQFRPNTRLRAIPVTLIKGIADGRAESIAFSLWSIALAFVVQYAMFREQYGHYFLLIYPFLAALLGRQISLGFRSLGEYSGSGEGRGVRLGLFCLVSAGLAMPLGTGIFRSAGNVDLAESSIVQYEWKGLSGNKRLDDWVKALFWQSEWALYRPVPGYHSYLWSRVPFPEALPMAEFIKKNSTDGETLTGSSIIAPLLALLSGRKLAAGEIDTNAKRFMTGILDERRFWESVCADRLRYVVCDWNSHFTPAMMNTAATPKSWFHLVASGDELAGTPSRMLPVLLYERNGADDFDSSCAWVSP